MKSWHYLDALIIPELTAHAADSGLYLKQISQRRIAHHDDDFGTNRGDFAE